MSETLFIGYLSLEEWLRAVDKKRPVYALLNAEVGESKYDLRTDEMVVEVAQPEDGESLVHYARLPAGKLRYQAGEPFDRDHDERVKQAESLSRIVDAWLETEGLTILRGRISRTNDLSLVRSWASFIEFDKNAGEYRLRKNSPDVL